MAPVNRYGVVALVLLAVAGGVGVGYLSRPRAPEVAADPGFLMTTLPSRGAAPELNLTDSSGQVRMVRDYAGKVVVMFFGFRNCPDVCPTELFKLSQVMRALGADADRVQVLYITLDPERDTPELMGQYVKAFDPRFEGLTGTRSRIDEVAASYYVAHQKSGNGDHYMIDHSTSTYFIDTQGRWRLLGSMETGVDSVVHDIRLLLQTAETGVNS
ncbi:MAG: SCO family protein [Steroidobacteraceae bacterium]